MRTPNEPTDSFSLPPSQPKPAPVPKPEVWRDHKPGFVVNDAGQLKTDIPEPTWPAMIFMTAAGTWWL